MAVSLISMPELPMTTIMNSLDYQAIQVLRKTCWKLRNFMDDKKPGEGVIRIEILENNEEIILNLKGPSIFLKYEKSVNGCKISWQKRFDTRVKIVENLDYLNAALKDFEIALNNQKSILENIKVTTNGTKLMEKFEELMKTSSPVLVKSLHLEATCQSQLCRILESTDSKHLKSILFTFLGQNGESIKIEESVNVAREFTVTSIPFDTVDGTTLKTLKKTFILSADYDKHFRLFTALNEFSFF